MANPTPRFELEPLFAQQARMQALARRLLADEHGAEDVVQEAWIAALEHPPREALALGHWLNGVVRRLASKRRRGEAREQARERRAARPERAPDSGQAAEQLRTQRLVLDAVIALEEPLRACVHARYFEQLAPREIARREGVSIHTVNDRLKRARRKLRAQLERRVQAEGGASWSLALLPLARLSARAVARLGPRLAGGSTLAVSATQAAGWQAGSTWLLEMIWMKKLLLVAVVLLALVGGSVWISQGGDAVAQAPAEARLGSLEAPLETLAPQPTLERTTDPVGERRAPTAVLAGSAASAADWVVRGRASLGTKGPAAGLAVRARLWRGYDTDATPWIDQLLTSDEQGRLVWPLEAPASGVTLAWTCADEGASSQGEFPRIVPPGEPAPQDLQLLVYPLDASIFGFVRDANGAPIAGAQVQAGSRTSTREDGSYSLPASSYRLQEFVAAQALGMTRERGTVEIPAGGGSVRFDLTLHAALRLHGRVLDESGLPVAGASLLAPVKRAESDEQGRYELDHLSPGRYAETIVVQSDQYAPLTEFVSLGSTDLEHDFVLDAGVRLEGRLIDEHERSIGGARIVLGAAVGINDALSVVNSDDGRFVFAHAPRGPRTLWISHPAFADARQELDVPKRGERMAEVTLVLRRGRGVSGRVVDAHGVGVPEVLVQPRQENEMVGTQVRSAEDGSFALTHLPDEGVELWCWKRGWDKVQRAIPAGELTQLELVMNPAGAVAGRVIDAQTGEPLRSFRVRLHSIAEPGQEPLALWASWTREGHAFDSADGGWQTSELALPIGRSLGVEVLADGYASSPITRALITAEPEPEALLIALSAGRRVSGRVIDGASGAAVANALVSCELDPEAIAAVTGTMSLASESSELSTHTDAAGDFAFEHVPPGRLYLEARHPTDGRRLRSQPCQIEGQGGTTDFLLSFGGAGVLTGVLADAAGEPRAAVELALFAIEVRGIVGVRVWRTRSQADGRFTFAGLAPGYYRIGRELEAPAWPVADLGIAEGLGVLVSEEGATQLRLAPQGTATLEGLLTAEGELPERVELRLNCLPKSKPTSLPLTHPSFATIAEQGHFRVENMPAGEYDVELGWFEGQRQVIGRRVKVVVEAGADNRCELALSPR